jgi:hypothetical protein
VIVTANIPVKTLEGNTQKYAGGGKLKGHGLLSVASVWQVVLSRESEGGQAVRAAFNSGGNTVAGGQLRLQSFIGRKKNGEQSRNAFPIICFFLASSHAI